MKDLQKARSNNWRWVILPATFLTMVVQVGVNYNCGVLNDALLETYDTNAVETSWLMSYYCALFALGAPIASAAILLTDCRSIVTIAGVLGLAGFASSSLVRSFPVLYITLGLSGFAQALGHTGSVLTLSYYFPDNLPLVNGVCLAGSGMGSFIHPVLTQIFLDTYGFNGTMLLLGGMSFHSTCLGMLCRPSPLEIQSKAFLAKRQQSKWKIIRSKIIPPACIFKFPAFVVLIPTMFLFSVAFQSMVVILPSHIKRYVGLSIQEGSVAAMLFGAGSVASRLLSGVAASDKNVGEAVLLTGMAGLLSVLSFCGKFIMEFYRGAYAFSFFFGLYSGGQLSLLSSLAMEIVGLELSAHGYGLILFVFGVAGFTGPPLVALIVETQGPDWLFISCGVICFLVSALTLLMTHLRKFSKDTTSMNASLKDLTSFRDMSIDIFEDDANKNGKLIESRGMLKECNTVPEDECIENGFVAPEDECIENGFVYEDQKDIDELSDNPAAVSFLPVKDDAQRSLL